MNISQCAASFVNRCKQQTIFVAYSGGIDSHVLLHSIQSAIGIAGEVRLVALHIHHQLSPHADDWQRHCQQIAKQLAVEFIAVKVDVEQDSRQSLEAAAREARYQAIIEHTEQASVIALGHHQDDQLETFFLQLKRGAGPAGLSAMASQHDKQGRQFFRPFLDVTQQQIVEYAEQHQLVWIEDQSNQHNRFDRNFLRNTVLPVLSARWPSFSATVSRSAKLCAEQQSLLSEVVVARLEECLECDNSINITKLKCYSRNWQKQILRHWLSNYLTLMPSMARLEELISLVAGGVSGDQRQWHVAPWIVYAYHDRLTCVEQKHIYQKMDIPWRGDKLLAWGPLWQVECLPMASSLKDIPIPLAVLHSGSEIVIQNYPFSSDYKPQSSSPSKALHQWFKLWSVLPWQRRQIAQVWIAGELVGLMGKGATESWLQRCQPQTCRFLHLSLSKSENLS